MSQGRWRLNPISALRIRLFILLTLATLPSVLAAVYAAAANQSLPTNLLIAMALVSLAVTYLGAEKYVLRKVQDVQDSSTRLLNEMSEREQRMSVTNTVLRAQEQSLHMLSEELMRVQETEREHIARELHDDIGQNLTAIKINLQVVKASHPELSSTVDESIRILERILTAVRNLSLDLRPPLMDEAGLYASLRWYLAGQSDRSNGLQIEFRPRLEEARLPASYKLGIFRIVQEAVTNIVRHANARSASVSLEPAGDRVELKIQDDGSGFDLTVQRQNLQERVSLGLIGMRERAKQMGGDFEIESRPGQGTVVRVRIPLRASPSNT